MRTRSPLVPLVVLVLLAAGLAVPASAGPPRACSAIQPGSAEQTPAERALTAEDVPGGETGGVVLVDETCWTDFPRGSVVRFHQRAKILSEKGLDLATISLEWKAGVNRKKDFWARAILPDGTVRHLRWEDLHACRGKYGRRLRTGTLPGVVPGTVIDWGVEYFLQMKRYSLRSYDVTGRYPVLRRTREWIPLPGTLSAWYSSVRPGLDVRIERLGDRLGDRIIRLEGRNLPPTPADPWSLPVPLRRDHVVFYWVRPQVEEPRAYWNAWAREVIAHAEEFRRRSLRRLPKVAAEILSARGLAADAPAEARARAIHDWILSEFRNRDAWNLHGNPPVTDEERADRRHWSAARVLRRGEGDGTETDYLAWALLRAAGVEAHLVGASWAVWPSMAWDLHFLDRDVFAQTLVAVDLPDPHGGKRRVFLDPGTGLPFGRVPSEVTGWTALLVREDGYETVEIPEAPADWNSRAVEARLTPDPEGKRLGASWTVHLSGGQELGNRTLERRRGDRAFCEICRAADTEGLLEARREGNAPPGQGMAAFCRLERPMEPAADGSVEVALDGPWWPSLYPDLDLDGPRTSPVRLYRPETWHLVLAIDVPPGLVPASLPERVDLASPWGRFTLAAMRQGDIIYVEADWRLERRFVPLEDWPRFRDWMKEVVSRKDVRIRLVPEAAAAAPTRERAGL